MFPLNLISKYTPQLFSTYLIPQNIFSYVAFIRMMPEVVSGFPAYIWSWSCDIEVIKTTLPSMFQILNTIYISSGFRNYKKMSINPTNVMGRLSWKRTIGEKRNVKNLLPTAETLQHSVRNQAMTGNDRNTLASAAFLNREMENRKEISFLSLIQMTTEHFSSHSQWSPLSVAGEWSKSTKAAKATCIFDWHLYFVVVLVFFWSPACMNRSDGWPEVIKSLRSLYVIWHSSQSYHEICNQDCEQDFMRHLAQSDMQ